MAAGVEFADRLAYYGFSGNLIQYLTKVLNQPNATAAKNVSYWIGVSSLFPLLGGFIADSYVGRFYTIIVSSIIYLLVCTLLLPLLIISTIGILQAVYYCT